MTNTYGIIALVIALCFFILAMFFEGLLLSSAATVWMLVAIYSEICDISTKIKK